MVTGLPNKPRSRYVDLLCKLSKGFVRLGHDTHLLGYGDLLAQFSPVKNRALARLLAKSKTDRAIGCYARDYRPDMIFFKFPRHLDRSTVVLLRQAAPNALLIGIDSDLWPEQNPGRIETARELDILLATNNGGSLDAYRRAGVKQCAFLPNACDPDLEYRHPVEERWRCDLLWTGKVQHKGGSGDSLRREVLTLLANDARARLYGCLGRQDLDGIDYLHAISGARIGISINADNSIPLYHSDRFTHYTACGTMVLAKRVPDTELLMADKRHAVYFDTPGECLELAGWYLAHEAERRAIADAGMARCHACFNATRMAAYILHLIESGCTPDAWQRWQSAAHG